MREKLTVNSLLQGLPAHFLTIVSWPSVWPTPLIVILVIIYWLLKFLNLALAHTHGGTQYKECVPTSYCAV